MIIAEEMMRRSGAKGIEVRFWDDKHRETRVRIEKDDGVDQKRRV